MKKAYMFRIYPNKNQEVTMVRTLNTCRHLYNDALAVRKKQAELNRLKKTFDVFPWGKPEWIYYEDQANDLSEYKTDFQKEIHSQVLQNVLKRVQKSMENFFRGSEWSKHRHNEAGSHPTCRVVVHSVRLQRIEINIVMMKQEDKNK